MSRDNDHDALPALCNRYLQSFDFPARARYSPHLFHSAVFRRSATFWRIWFIIIAYPTSSCGTLEGATIDLQNVQVSNGVDLTELLGGHKRRQGSG